MKTPGYNEIDTKTINANWRIKVYGTINGKFVNTLVGVRGLLRILDGNLERLLKFVARAFASMETKVACKIYRGPVITFYAK